MADEEKGPEGELTEPDKVGDEKGLIGKACTAYGIPSRYLLASRVVGTEAILVTAGGAKVRYRLGQEVPRLSKVRVTGIPVEQPRKK